MTSKTLISLIAATAWLAGCQPELNPNSLDLDGDGIVAGNDCDDSSSAVGPGFDEICDGVDNDCDTLIDEAGAVGSLTFYADDDGDGVGSDISTTACTQPERYAATTGDCDDTDAAIHIGAVEDDCSDPTDYNCDGSVGYADDDGDGFAACDDCDDSAGAIHDNAIEVCDGLDNNCDGRADEPGAIGDSLWFADNDADGFGTVAVWVISCDRPPGFVANDDDCDDHDNASHPGADELCDGVDNNCNTLVDDNASGLTWYADADGDGIGGPSSTTACEQPDQYVATAGDCNDSNAAIYPGAPETECSDPTDYNCDGSVAFADADNDGHPACEDCDDSAATIHGDALEVCDGVDNNCDGATDEPGAVGGTIWFADTDADGFGDALSPVTQCVAPSGSVANKLDCDDTDAAAFPGADELCNGTDNNCNAIADDDAIDMTTWYADLDGDGEGGELLNVDACSQPAGYVSTADDCDDLDATCGPCVSGVCPTLIGSDANPGQTCDEIITARPSAPSGTYWIDPTGSDAFEVHCDMQTLGGGWTLCGKFDRDNTIGNTTLVGDFARIADRRDDIRDISTFTGSQASQDCRALIDAGATRVLSVGTDWGMPWGDGRIMNFPSEVVSNPVNLWDLNLEEPSSSDSCVAGVGNTYTLNDTPLSGSDGAADLDSRAGLLGDGAFWTNRGRSGANFSNAGDVATCGGTWHDTVYWSWTAIDGTIDTHNCAGDIGELQLGTGCHGGSWTKPTYRYNLMLFR